MGQASEEDYTESEEDPSPMDEDLPDDVVDDDALGDDGLDDDGLDDDDDDDDEEEDDEESPTKDSSMAKDEVETEEEETAIFYVVDSRKRGAEEMANEDAADDDDKTDIEEEKSEGKSEEKSEEEDDEKKASDDSTPAVVNVPPQIANGVAEFHVQTICQHVLCSLCSGIYREPVTTIKCQHTFCKSCLTIALHSAWHTSLHNACPSCRTYLGRACELTKISIPDRTLEALIDKVLFPHIALEDEQAEALFYRQRGMARKEPSLGRKHLAKQSRLYRRRRSPLDPWFVFYLHPAADEPVLPNPCLQVESTIRMRQLKKFVQQELALGEECDIQICCNNVPLGDELSVQFVQRSVWMDTTQDATLKLTYRLLPETAAAETE